MPYIVDRVRPGIKKAVDVAADRCGGEPGNLNYAITALIHTWIGEHPNGLCYRTLNEAIGVLECAKLELYRRIAGPYEDEKCKANGDIGILEE